MTIVCVGIDLAKNVFAVNGLNQAGPVAPHTLFSAQTAP